jgi:hypothetical protein
MTTITVKQFVMLLTSQSIVCAASAHTPEQISNPYQYASPIMRIICADGKELSVQAHGGCHVRFKDIPVEKVWDDLTNIEGIRPDSVTFKLVGRVGDEEVVDPYTTTIYKSEDDTNNTARSWIGEFKDVQVFFNGKLINYTLEEVTMDKCEYVSDPFDIDEWISNVIPTQLEYFRKEMNNLLNRGLYESRK